MSHAAHVACVSPAFVPLCLRIRMHALDGQRADTKCQRVAQPANPRCQASPVGPAATVTGTPHMPYSQK